MSYNTFILANNILTTLAAPVSPSDTTITLSSSAGLPSLIADQAMPITLTDAATGAVNEICYVTAITGATLTVLRAQEGTGALSWSVGDIVFSGPTEGTVAVSTGNPNNTFQVADPILGNDATNLGNFYGDIASPGYYISPNIDSPSGQLITQFGSVTTNNTSTTVIFPIAFPNAVLYIEVSIQFQTGTPFSQTGYETFTNTGFNLSCAVTNNLIRTWKAVGY